FATYPCTGVFWRGGLLHSISGMSCWTLWAGIVGHLWPYANNGGFLMTLRQERAGRPHVAPLTFEANRGRASDHSHDGVTVSPRGSSAAHFADPAHPRLRHSLGRGGVQRGDETYQLGYLVFKGPVLAHPVVDRVLQLQRGFNAGHQLC